MTQINSTAMITGPFGRYEHGTYGSVLNSLCKEGVPLSIVENLTIGEKEHDYCIVKQNDEEFARYKNYKGIDKPLFMFQNQNYSSQTATWGDDGLLRPKLKLCMYHHGSASLVISEHRDKDLFTKELYEFINGMLGANCAHITDESSDWQKQNNKEYNLKQNAGAFFQGGSGGYDKEYLYIEFWKSEGAQAFVDYINENFVYVGRVKPPEMSMGY